MYDKSHNTISISLITALTLWGIEVSENIEFVKAGKHHKDEVPKHENNAVLLVQLPPIHVRSNNKEHDSGEEGDS